MFDYKFMKIYAKEYGQEHSGIDTLKIARKVHKDGSQKASEHYVNTIRLRIRLRQSHHDALATAKLYHLSCHYFQEK